MKEEIKVLEHEILRCLYRLSTFITKKGSQEKGHIPVYEISYASCTIQFGTLVDLLNKPQNYTDDKIPQEDFFYFQNLTKTFEEIDTSIYGYKQVAYAIETLKQNGQVKDSLKRVYLDIDSREIVLTERGAIDFRDEFYVKKYQKETFESQLVLSTISTEDSVRKTNIFQIRLLVMTGIIALSSCIIQGLILKLEYNKVKIPLSQKLTDSLTLQLKSISKNQDETYLLLSRRIDSLTNLLRKKKHDMTKKENKS